MMKNITLLILLLSAVSIQCQEYYGPIPPITTGYGAFGTHTVVLDSFLNSTSDDFVTIAYPEDATGPVPTFFYCHGYSIRDYKSHLALMNFVASKGYAMVFSPYPSSIFHEANNNKMLSGFIESVEHYPAIIDTTRVGIIGHSYGAGVIPWVGKKFFVEKNWGANGKFMFLSAPWFIRQMSQEDLTLFPADCKMICQVYDYDKTNDHRIAIDLFCNINIPVEEKDFILVERDIVADGETDYIYNAGHSVITTEYSAARDWSYNAQDYYAIFRLLDALAVYTFEDDVEAKNIALGNGHPDQIYMGDQLSPLEVTDTPVPRHPESFYDSWPCHTDFFGVNPRIDYCDQVCPEIVSTETILAYDKLSLYPNPTKGALTINIDASLINKIVIYNSLGQLVLTKSHSNTIDLVNLANGIYHLKIMMTDTEVVVKSFVKE